MSEPTKARERTAPTRTRLFRGKLCPVTRSVRNVLTGAIYDLVSYERQVTHRKTGEVTTETLTRKMRRPGTGLSALQKEVEIETEVEVK